jgi:hypothetical protein
MNHPDQHDAEGRKEMDAVSRAYRDAGAGDDMAPPAALDDAIRAAAHRAVHSGPQLAGSGWFRRWTPQFAVAAVVVLSASVVFIAIEERPDQAPASIQKIALNQAAEPPAEAALPMQARIVAATPSAGDAFASAKKKGAGAVVADAQVSRQKDAAILKEERGLVSLAPATAPPPPSLAAASVPTAAGHLPPGLPAAAPATTAATPAPFPATAADAVAPGRKEARADARNTAAPETKRIEEKVTVAGAVRSREDIDAPAKPAAPMMKQLAPAAAVAPQASVAIAPVRAPLVDAARSNAQAPKASDSAGVGGVGHEENIPSGKADESERPGPWLKRLLELRERGQFKELREQVARFKKFHPDIVLPKTLTELPGD